LPKAVEEFKKNKTCSLHTVKCFPWSYKGKSLLIGDAAHAVLPFIGQGMNCGFEDVSELDRIIDKY
jgi:kynurenine 3-monooxygenase